MSAVLSVPRRRWCCCFFALLESGGVKWNWVLDPGIKLNGPPFPPQENRELTTEVVSSVRKLSATGEKKRTCHTWRRTANTTCSVNTAQQSIKGKIIILHRTRGKMYLHVQRMLLISSVAIW